METKTIKVFLGFIVGYLLMRLSPSDIPIFGSVVSDYLAWTINFIGFLLILWTGYFIIVEVLRVTRK